MRRKAAGNRARSAAIVRVLRAELEGGLERTYAELARAAGCSERTVRNYVHSADDTLGFAVDRLLGADRRVRVRAVSGSEPSVDQLASMLAREILRPIFPIAGTSFDQPHPSSQVQVVVMARGAYQYGELHLRALRTWLHAASQQPRRSVRFEYDSTSSGPGERIVWPLGFVVRDLARVYLAGVPAEATEARDVRTYGLERVGVGDGNRMTLLSAEDAGEPPVDLDQAVVRDAVDSPFSVYPPNEGDLVNVRVRFSPEQARHVEHRLWHRNQRMRKQRDGSLDLTFGPCNRGEAEAWVRQWGDSALEVKLSRPQVKRSKARKER